MLVTISEPSERDSLCRPRHSICLQLLIKPIAYVHPGIPSYPCVKSSLLLPLLLPLPSPPLSPFPPPRCPLPIFPPPFPIAPLSISSSRCPPPHCHLLPAPIAPLPISPSPLPPSRFPLPVSPSLCPLLPVRPPHLPLPSPLSALASPSASFPPLPLPPQAARCSNLLPELEDTLKDGLN